MASLSYDYSSDAMLSSLITAQIENSASYDVATYDIDFTPAQLEVLVPLRAFILCCIANVKARGDMFDMKKGFYDIELKKAVEIARSQIPQTGNSKPKQLFSISLDRC